MTVDTSQTSWRSLKALAGGLILAAVLVGPAVQPAGATTVIANQGVGTLQATLTYAPPGAAKLNTNCTQGASFGVSASSVVLAVNLQAQVDSSNPPIVGTGEPSNGVGNDGFAGLIPGVSGSGGGPGACEGTSSGNGPLRLTVPTTTDSPINDNSFGCDGTFGSTTLSGNYTRLGPNMTAILFGKCHVNHNPVHIVFLFDGAWTPNGGAGLTQPGITQPTLSANLAGEVIVLPFG